MPVTVTGTPAEIERDWSAIVEDSEARRSCSPEAAEVLYYGRVLHGQCASRFAVQDALRAPDAVPAPGMEHGW